MFYCDFAGFWVTSICFFCQTFMWGPIQNKVAVFLIKESLLWTLEGSTIISYSGKGAFLYWHQPLVAKEGITCIQSSLPVAGCDLLNSSPPSATYMRQWTGSTLVQVMACRLFGAKPLPEPMRVYCWLNSWEQISEKFESEFYHFHSRKCIWNCRLPKRQPFCPGGDELNKQWGGVVGWPSLMLCDPQFNFKFKSISRWRTCVTTACRDVQMGCVDKSSSLCKMVQLITQNLAGSFVWILFWYRYIAPYV